MSDLVGSAPPRLLVSVRSFDEACGALTGGADIIDVKEPDRGSLGRADDGVIREIASLPQFRDGRIPLSIALGEVDESRTAHDSGLSPDIAYAKLGLAGLGRDPGWIARWQSARQRHETRCASPPRWIGVIYADRFEAQSPPATHIIAAAAQTQCAGVLVDTYDKSGGRLLDCVALNELADWARRARDQGLLFAVAGRLVPDDLPRVCSVSPDIIAVRSAVCRLQDRLGCVCEERIAEFKRTLLHLHSPLPASVANG